MNIARDAIPGNKYGPISFIPLPAKIYIMRVRFMGRGQGRGRWLKPRAAFMALLRSADL